MFDAHERVTADPHVVLKVLPDAMAYDAERVARFEREAYDAVYIAVLEPALENPCQYHE